MQGAEQLSQAVLKSGWFALPLCPNAMFNVNAALDPEVVRQSPDMTTQLTGRKERLSWLIGFINENGVLVKVRTAAFGSMLEKAKNFSKQMSRTSRQKLATDAEKLYSSHQLWLNYNQFLSLVSLFQMVLRRSYIRQNITFT